MADSTLKHANSALNETKIPFETFNLREARKASNMTQVQVAEAMGVSQNRISRMENGNIKTMGIDWIRQYIIAIGGTMTIDVSLPHDNLKLI